LCGRAQEELLGYEHQPDTAGGNHHERPDTMNPNADEIANAKRVLSTAGYLCVHIDRDAEWTIDVDRCVTGQGIAVECDSRDAEGQMLAIKRGYGIDC